MQDSIFTKIVKGEIPSHKIYEDEQTLAFLNVYPAQPGHTMIIPKKQVEFVWDLDSETYHAVMATAQKVAKHLKMALKTPYVAEMVVGVGVPHAHVHLIPFSESEQLLKEFEPKVGEPDHDELAKMATKLRIGE